MTTQIEDEKWYDCIKIFRNPILTNFAAYKFLMYWDVRWQCNQFRDLSLISVRYKHSHPSHFSLMNWIWSQYIPHWKCSNIKMSNCLYDFHPSYSWFGLLFELSVNGNRSLLSCCHCCVIAFCSNINSLFISTILSFFIYL